MESGIESNVVFVIQDQVQLDLGVTRTGEKREVEVVGLWWDGLGFGFTCDVLIFGGVEGCQCF